MKIVKTRDADVAKRAAEIWALATTKRDAEVADIDQVELSQAAPLIQRVLDDSDRSFLVALTVTEEDSDYAEESENPTLAFMALSPEPGGGRPRRPAPNCASWVSPRGGTGGARAGRAGCWSRCRHAPRERLHRSRPVGARRQHPRHLGLRGTRLGRYPPQPAQPDRPAHRGRIPPRPELSQASAAVRR